MELKEPQDYYPVPEEPEGELIDYDAISKTYKTGDKQYTTCLLYTSQIQNGISTITGTVGPLTINTMKKLAIITKMDPNDTPQVNVCLIPVSYTHLHGICR